jgi:hypothetical protein
MFRRRSGVLCAVLVLCLLAGLAGTASAADRRLAAASRVDPTGGATAYVELWQRDSDGAVYPKVWIQDTKADCICAHAAVMWAHVNGNTYPDYGSYVCGHTQRKGPFVWGTRNWTQYRSVSLAAFVDNGAPATQPLYDFAEHPPTFDDASKGGGGIGAIGAPISTYRAGRHLTIIDQTGSAPPTRCTAAFAITTDKGASGLTAAHCATGNDPHTGDLVLLELGGREPRNRYAVMGVVAATLAKAFDDRDAVAKGTDAQMFPLGDNPYEQVIARGNKTPWKVTGTLPTILQDEGIRVCFAGRTSGADRCGEITGSMKHLKCTDIKVRGGDSGGPVYTRARNGKTRAVGS